MKIVLSRFRLFYLRIESYLYNHIDFILGVCNIGTGWSVLAGPERTKFTNVFLGETFIPGVSLLTSGCVLVLISLTDRKWKDSYFLWMVPCLVYIWHVSIDIFRETEFRPNGILFVMISFLLITFLSLRKTKFLNR